MLQGFQPHEPNTSTHPENNIQDVQSLDKLSLQQRLDKPQIPKNFWEEVNKKFLDEKKSTQHTETPQMSNKEANHSLSRKSNKKLRKTKNKTRDILYSAVAASPGDDPGDSDDSDSGDSDSTNSKLPRINKYNADSSDDDTYNPTTSNRWKLKYKLGHRERVDMTYLKKNVTTCFENAEDFLEQYEFF